MGVSTANSSKYTPKASADDESLDSATTSAGKTEKLGLQTSQNHSHSGAKQTFRRPASPALRKPALVSSSPSASCHIRHRYLSKLGLAGSSSSPTKAQINTSNKIQEKVIGILKTKNSKPKAAPLTAPSVSFKTLVSIRCIPDRNQYDNRQDLWIQKEEFEELFHRNCMEYAADGWNWENATEESEFLLYENELVHPVHFQGQTCNMQRQFLMTMYAQRESDV
ncbi:unnamed protein product [Cylindrotheca closterium]|uniref:Uncharacterized protein n=1 Tax=Cylindrotheca closterium TaxID=2856 RepID=A0AAD2CLG4_9STRA|nr:unnamed protein product [Cylindrotheca closterium]